MKLEIVENKGVESKKEPNVDIWLEKMGNKVEVKAKSDKIHGYYTILVFTPEGKFYRAGCVPEKVGFSVSTPEGKIIEQ